MHPDPLMPAFRRFPRNPPPITSENDALPSPIRPFALSGARPGGVPQAKHRTPATQVKNSQPTTSDGKNPTTKTDTFTTPDD